MIDRYTRPAMGRLWTEEARLQRWLDVELALVDVLAERGEAPPEAARRLRERSRVDVERMKAIEAEVKHDVIAFVSSVAEKVGDDGRWLHLGLTSSDVVDTAFALQLRDALHASAGGIVDRPEAGSLLRDRLFAPGQSVRWDRLVEQVSGLPLTGDSLAREVAAV